jgi:aminopeptidase N
MRRIVFLLCISLCNIAVAQSFSDNSFRNSNNPYYWQNRKPDAAYWQQDVHYTIAAQMVEDDNRIDGNESLTYWNNSPDTLRFVYFHLFQNAFIKGSHLHALELENKTKPHLGKKEADGKGIVVESITSNGKGLQVELDNTIMKVYLPEPLLPGAKTVFDIHFKTYYDNGASRRRMQMYDAWGQKHYNGVQWFPKICVYDRKFGWDTYQHLNKEFYADFGAYDVALDFPSNYVLEATGSIHNSVDVLPKDFSVILDVLYFSS